MFIFGRIIVIETLFSEVNLYYTLLGGVLIGLSAAFLLLFNGRIAGICGIAFGLFNLQKGDKLWRLLFVIGLVLGVFLAHWLTDIAVPEPSQANLPILILGGLLVGFGTQIGSGCTSGHGVCGIARLSNRSILATLLFISFGMISMTVFRHLLGII